MENLRWILLLAGVAVILVVYLASYYQARRKQPSVPRKTSRTQPVMDDTDSVDDVVPGNSIDEELEQLGQLISGDDALVVEEVSIIELPTEKREPVSTTDRVFMLFIEAPSGVPFRGPLLLGALASAGLEFGDMDIFHHIEQVAGQEKILFSVANIREPGIFDMSGMEDFTSDGIVLFMQIPGAVDAVRAFDAMVDSSNILAGHLDSRVCDAAHSPLTKQAISHMREEVISCQLQQRVANAVS